MGGSNDIYYCEEDANDAYGTKVFQTSLQAILKTSFNPCVVIITIHTVFVWNKRVSNITGSIIACRHLVKNWFLKFYSLIFYSTLLPSQARSIKLYIFGRMLLVCDRVNLSVTDILLLYIIISKI